MPPACRVGDKLTVHADSHTKVDGKWLGKAGVEIHLHAGEKMVLEAGTEMTLKAGGSWIKLDPSGVRMGGSRINLGGGGGPGSGSGAAPELPITPDLVDYFTEYFILKANGTPFPDAQYTIILDDQSTFGGVTDKDGKTSMVIDRSKKVVSVVFDQGFPIEIA
ncbi:hypothetical protein CE91St38_08690 [Desulfovibrionaceae bacterium]|nr:hypothetical protein CE91St38_08690 [Desulfovibrionaceae bacterium]GKI11413.1 hypothetical protein CE91St39_08670 [Desulfovibrionaceae bacterium]